jgi:hypothetical protein
MSQLFNKTFQFFAPDSPTGTIPPVTTPSGPRGMGKEDTIDFLASVDDEIEPIDLTLKGDKTPIRGKEETQSEVSEETETEVEEPTEEDELAELEQELEGPTDDQLEFVTPVRRKEILAKYPTLFKDFPYLEKAYYREQQFTEYFPTIAEAKTAAEKAETLDKFENEIMGGTTENILKAVKEENPEGFAKLVDEYLPTLARVDERAYMHLLGNVTKHTIVAMVKEAKRSSNDALQNAAALLNQFVFGSTEFTPPQNLSKGERPEDKRVNDETKKQQEEFLRGRFDSVNGDLNSRVNNSIRAAIEQNIDPRDTMAPYVKRNAVRDAVETVSELMSKDARFKSITDKLWERAFKENFSKNSTDDIKKAFLSKARTLLPAVIKKARNEALKGTGHRVRNDEEETTSNRGPVPPGKPRTTQAGKITKGSDIPKGMSTLDFLNS